MLARVRRIEAVRMPALSPIEADFGSLDAFDAHCRAGIAAGIYDEIDMPVIILAVRRWHCESSFSGKIIKASGRL